MAARKNTKKRPATTKLESKPTKKRSVGEENHGVPPKPVEKKRSRPVTHTFPIIEEEESDSDSEKEDSEGNDWEVIDEDEGNEGDDAVMDDDEPPIDEDAMDIDGTTKPKVPKDPNGTV